MTAEIDNVYVFPLGEGSQLIVRYDGERVWLSPERADMVLSPLLGGVGYVKRS